MRWTTADVSGPVSTLPTMPNRGPIGVGPPRDYVTGEWPHGQATADAPRALEHARTVTFALLDALEGRTVTEVAAGAGLARSTAAHVGS